jgi:hypothetical protein
MIETGVNDGVLDAGGVRVTTFGTQSCCPDFKLVWLLDMQFACWSCVMLTP